MNLEQNLHDLYDRLMDGSYLPGRSICFVVTRPKAREVWAADFTDRIVHHLLYNHIAERFHRAFIADSCACIPGRGTLYGAERLESKVRSITQNWSRPAMYLKGDLSNFFVSIDKRVVFGLLRRKVREDWWLRMAELILFHDPRTDYEQRGNSALLDLVPPHKRLINCDADHGLPIGNLSSQFFANVLLNALDQHVKHRIGAKYYVRYVDDFVILHESARWLHEARLEIESFLTDRLGLQLNPRKTFIQPVGRGIDFVGQVIKPWHRTARRKTYRQAIRRTVDSEPGDLWVTANSYFGLLGQAPSSHHDRARLANAVRRKGHCVNFDLSKTYRRSNPDG